MKHQQNGYCITVVPRILRSYRYAAIIARQNYNMLKGLTQQ